MAESPESGTVIEPGSLNPDSDLSCSANGRVEIDISAPFESVREAATRFGGFGFWKPSHNNKVPEAFQENVEETDGMELRAQTAELQKNLIVKEREKLEVIKELEATKAIVEELNSKLQQKNEDYDEEKLREEVQGCMNPAGAVLKDLSQAKMNLCKTTVDLAGIRDSVEELRKKLKEERDALEKTRERVMQNTLEEEEVRLRLAKVTETGEKVQEFKEIREKAWPEVVKAMAEIKQTRDHIKTVKMSLVAARKMKEAAKVAEAIAIAEIQTITGSKNTDEAAMSRVETSKRELEEAVERVNTANATKLEAEEELRNWRSKKEQRRKPLSSSVNNTAKFKKTTTHLMDVNGLNLPYIGSSSSVPIMKPTMSIGQILSKKLLITEDSNMNVGSEGRKMSLGQMLANNNNGDGTMNKTKEKRSKTRKRKNFGFAKISVLLSKKSKNKKKKKKIALNLK